MAHGVVDELAAAVRALPAAVDDAARIDRIRALEELKGAPTTAYSAGSRRCAGSAASPDG